MRRQIAEEQEEQKLMDLDAQDVWEELSDYEKIVDERELEPDYYIDKPPTPVFKENPKGTDREVQVIDEELFDFEMEAEPIL